MRCFIAVDLPEELKQKVINLQKQLSKSDVKLVEPENMHFTLKFLGEVDENTISKVKERLEQIASSTNSFTILISGIGVFPDEKFIRVVWIGADNENQNFIKLHEAVDNALSDMFKKEKHVPHLTICRVRSKGKDLEDFIAQHRNVEIGTMPVNTIKLKKSTLTRNVPVYEDVEVFDLGS